MDQGPSVDQVNGPIEVRVHQYGLMIADEWCRTEAEAFARADFWHRERGVHCDIVYPPGR